MPSTADTHLWSGRAIPFHWWLLGGGGLALVSLFLLGGVLVVLPTDARALADLPSQLRVARWLVGAAGLSLIAGSSVTGFALYARVQVGGKAAGPANRPDARVVLPTGSSLSAFTDPAAADPPRAEAPETPLLRSLLSMGSHQLAQAQEHAAGLAQVTVTIEELSETATQIAEAAVSVATAAAQAITSANRGQEAVQESVVGMDRIRSRVNDIIARILALSTQMQRVDEIVTMLNEIAAQTHITALNAAVESAGAGAAGQRFSVVASEVKKLAQRSQGATREAREILAQVQAATAAAVMATEEGLKEADRGQRLAQQSGEANTDIIEMVSQTAQLATTIGLATGQQRTALAQVAVTMRAMLERTRLTASRRGPRDPQPIPTPVGDRPAVARGTNRMESRPMFEG